MRLTADSNVLVYALEDDDPRTLIARNIMASAPTLDMILTTQVFGEFLNVIKRKHPDRVSEAVGAVASWSILYPVIATATEHLVAAAHLAERHRLQFWDSLILTVAASAEVEVMFTEDLQDGASIDGIRIVNPFAPANREIVQTLLTPPPGTA